MSHCASKHQHARSPRCPLAFWVYVLGFVLAATGKVSGQYTVVTQTSGPGILHVTTSNTSTNYIAFAVRESGGTNFGGWVAVCTSSAAGVCAEFVCPAANSCTLLGNIAGASKGAANTSYTFTRQFQSKGNNDPGITLGNNNLLLLTASGNPTVDAALVNGFSGWGTASITVAAYTGTPSFNYSLQMAAPDVVGITITSVTGSYQGLGWKASAGSWPSWAAVCQASISDCVIVTCTSYTSCTASTVTPLNQVRVGNVVRIFRSMTGPAGVAVVPGSSTPMVWSSYAYASAPASLTVAQANTSSWSTFSTDPIVAAYSSTTPPFTWTISQPDLSNVALSFTTQASRYAAVGWRHPQSMFPDYVVVCDPSLSTPCADFTCTSASSTCSAATTTGVTTLGVSATNRTVTFQRPLVQSGSYSLQTGAQDLLWSDGPSPSSPISSSLLTNSVWTSFTSTLTPFAQPLFPLSIQLASSTTATITVTTNNGKYAVFGAGTSGTAGFPSLVFVCEPVNTASCGVYDCSTAASCTTSQTTVTQTRDAGTRGATLTMPASSLNVSTTGSSVFLYWLEASIPSNGLVMSSALVSNQSWQLYVQPVTPPSVNPTFPIVFTRPTEASLGVTMTPGTGKTAMLGWRRTASSLYPEDVVVCAPSAVSTCLDVVCVSASSCSARSMSILSTNSAKDTAAMFTRLLASGSVSLDPTKMMYLSWNIKDTAAGSTSLSSSTVNNVTWNQYTAAVPTATSSAFLVSCPPALLGLILIALSL